VLGFADLGGCLGGGGDPGMWPLSQQAAQPVLMQGPLRRQTVGCLQSS
jgi:hypothetical protein